MCFEASPPDVLVIFKGMMGCLSLSDINRGLEWAFSEQEERLKALLAKLFPGMATSACDYITLVP